MTAKPLKVTGFRGNPLRVVLNDGREAAITQKLANNIAASYNPILTDAIKDAYWNEWQQTQDHWLALEVAFKKWKES